MAAYKKIAGKGKRMKGPLATSIARLWLGPDHLLSQDQYGFFFTFHEKYRRFYFRDIQGITLKETSTSFYLTIFWLVLLLTIFVSSFLIHTILPWTPGLIGLVAAVSAPCFIRLGLNLWEGKSCEVIIHTAVQSEVLPSIGRLQRASNFLTLVRPLVAEAQGNLSGHEIPGLSSLPISTSPAELPSHPPLLPENMTRSSSVYMIALSVCLIAHSFFTGMLFFKPGIPMGVASTLLGIGASVFWMIGMIQASKHQIRPELRKYGWITLAYLSVVYIISFIYYSVESAKNPALAYDAMEWLRLIGERPISQSIFLKIYDSFIVLGSGILGFTGLFLQRPSTPPATANP